MSKKLASTYHYDPLDRLSNANTVQRFYNTTRIATEVEGDRKSRFFEADTQPLAVQQHGTEPGTALLATDQQTSVLNGISPLGDQHVQAYSPYGYHPFDASLNAAGFNGERPEPITGHYLLGQGYRAFNPVLMRFNSPDSWSPFGEGGINAYAYCDNDPMNKVDPTGHIPNAWKGLKNLFGRVPKRMRSTPSVATHTAPPVTTTLKDTGFPATPDYSPIAKNSNFNIEEVDKFKPSSLTKQNLPTTPPPYTRGNFNIEASFAAKKTRPPSYKAATTLVAYEDALNTIPPYKVGRQWGGYPSYPPKVMPSENSTQVRGEFMQRTMHAFNIDQGLIRQT